MEEQFDENGNPIIPEIEEDEDTTDYKALVEQERAEKEQEIAKKEKAEINFKSMAKKYNDLKKSSTQEPVNIAEQVSKQVSEEIYYANNPVAKEYQKEIKEIQAKTWMNPEDAMTFYLAKNKPELIQKKEEIWVDWVWKPIEENKDIKDMNYEELRPNQKQRG